MCPVKKYNGTEKAKKEYSWKNPSVSLSPTLARNERVEHYIRIKTHKPFTLRFWVESGVNVLCGWAQISLVLYFPNETSSIDLTLSWALFEF